MVRYLQKRRYRLEVRPPEPAEEDHFLHVIQVCDRKTGAMERLK